MNFAEQWNEIDDAVRTAVAAEMERRKDTRFDEESLRAAEVDLQDSLGYPDLILTSSATASAHAAFLSARLDGTSDVGVPAHVFPGMAGAARSAGLEPRFIPVGADLLPGESSYNSASSALVHFPWGDVRGASELTARLSHGLVFLDVSHATPRIPRPMWNHETTLAAIGSLGAGKFLSGMEMGFIASNKPGFLQQIAALGAVRRSMTFDVPPPVATKLRPHPVAVAILRAQLRRLPTKLAAHDETWGYLIPRLGEIEGLRVVTTSAPAERLFWRCVLEVTWLDGSKIQESDLVAQLRSRGLPVSRPEYLDEAVTLGTEQSQAPSSRPLAQIPRRYIALPGFVLLPRNEPRPPPSISGCRPARLS